MKALYAFSEEGEWVPRYVFELKVRERYDFDASCHYVQTSPDSHFTQKLIVSFVKGRWQAHDIRPYPDPYCQRA